MARDLIEPTIGNIVTPITWDGTNFHPPMSTVAGLLQVSIEAATEIVTRCMGYDGGAWVAMHVDAAGDVQADILTIADGEIRCYGYDGANWQKIRTDDGGNVYVRSKSANDFPVAPYGYDGATFRKFRLDASGHTQVDVLSSALPTGAATEATLADLAPHLGRNPTDESFATEASYANCGNTLRHTYTVPADKNAYVWGFSTWNNAPAANFCQWFLDYNGVGSFWHTTLTGDDVRQQKENDSLAWWLLPNDVLRLYNAQQDPAAVYMRAMVYITEFDAF